MEEDKFISIQDRRIRYRSLGSGPSVLLLLHGAVGSINDFAQQLDQKLGLSREQLTLVAFDLPGLGRSLVVPSEEQELEISTEAEPTLEYLSLCADVAAHLMRSLGHKTYSVAGWSEGARVACLLAAKWPARVDSLVLWGFLPAIERKSTEAIAKTRDTSTWEPTALAHYTSIYGEQRFTKLWHKYVDFLVASLESEPRLDLSEQLTRIKCPTLVLHGSEDPLVSKLEHVEPLGRQILDLDVVPFKGLAHNLHQARPAAFNKLLTSFVCSQPRVAS